MSFLNLTAISKSFGANLVVKGFDLSVEPGEFVSFLGPSGCGKTTVLRMIAGFERPTEGHITIGGRNVTDLAPNRRQIGMVFQSYALFPNMTVAGNIGFGLKIAGLAKTEAAARVNEMLTLIGLAKLAERYPYELSGGQQQRVALARALAPKPQVLLLDEPLSALDAKIRVSLREEIRAIQRQLGITTVFVTHDQEEAMALSDRIVVMNGGRAEQIGTPETIYNAPATRFVANFIGSLNVIEGRIGAQIGAAPRVLTWAGGQIALPEGIAAGPHGSATIGIRPQSLRPCPVDAAQMTGTVRNVEFLGAFTRLHVACGGAVLLVDCVARDHVPKGNGGTIGLSVASQDLVALSG